MDFSAINLCTSFKGTRRLGSGSLADMALLVKAAMEEGLPESILTFDDATGKVLDLDLRGSFDEVRARLGAPTPPGETPKGRGRPRLGVVAREVTLLPRHWDWLSAQPGGASVALRKLVEDARHGSEGKDAIRHAQEAAYSFMSAMAGDAPGYEEALRALFARDPRKFASCTSAWPEDVRDHARKLATPALQPTDGNHERRI